MKGWHEEDVELEGGCIGAVVCLRFDGVGIGLVVHDRISVVWGEGAACVGVR